MLGVQPYFLLQRFLGLVENFPWKYKLVNIENMPKQFSSEKSYGKWNKTKKNQRKWETYSSAKEL